MTTYLRPLALIALLLLAGCAALEPLVVEPPVEVWTAEDEPPAEAWTAPVEPCAEIIHAHGVAVWYFEQALKCDRGEEYRHHMVTWGGVLEDCLAGEDVADLVTKIQTTWPPPPVACPK